MATVAHPSDDPRYAELMARLDGLEAMIQAVAWSSERFFLMGRESVLHPRARTGLQLVASEGQRLILEAARR